jgi:hypothetical protein
MNEASLNIYDKSQSRTCGGAAIIHCQAVKTSLRVGRICPIRFVYPLLSTQIKAKDREEAPSPSTFDPSAQPPRLESACGTFEAYVSPYVGLVWAVPRPSSHGVGRNGSNSGTKVPLMVL